MAKGLGLQDLRAGLRECGERAGGPSGRLSPNPLPPPPGHSRTQRLPSSWSWNSGRHWQRCWVTVSWMQLCWQPPLPTAQELMAGDPRGVRSPLEDGLAEGPHPRQALSTSYRKLPAPPSPFLPPVQVTGLALLLGPHTGHTGPWSESGSSGPACLRTGCREALQSTPMEAQASPPPQAQNTKLQALLRVRASRAQSPAGCEAPWRSRWPAGAGEDPDTPLLVIRPGQRGRHGPRGQPP